MLIHLNHEKERQRAFTLAEVVIAIAVIAMTLGGILYGYLMSARRADMSAYFLAAQALALQRMEETRAVQWLSMSDPPVDDLKAANFPTKVDILDIPLQGTNILYATNYTTISDISSNPPLRMIKVDCVWKFPRGKVFTNSIATYRAPDQ
jgi:prepilin-type N-terminal cleavage/methylation domain-containing protein